MRGDLALKIDDGLSVALDEFFVPAIGEVLPAGRAGSVFLTAPVTGLCLLDDLNLVFEFVDTVGFLRDFGFERAFVVDEWLELLGGLFQPFDSLDLFPESLSIQLVLLDFVWCGFDGFAGRIKFGLVEAEACNVALERLVDFGDMPQPLYSLFGLFDRFDP
jgi:hypothetical protein